MPNHPAASLFMAMALALGIFLSHALEPPREACLATLAAAVLLMGRYKNRGHRIVFWSLAGLACTALGMWSMARVQPGNRPAHYAIVSSPSTGPVQIRLLQALRHNDYACRYLGEVMGIAGKKAEGILLVEISRDSAVRMPEPGEELLTHLIPSPVEGPRNPGQFDYRAYLRSLGVYGRLRLPTGTWTTMKESVPGFDRQVAALRGRLLGALEETGLGPDELGIAKALLLGDRTRVETDLYASYKRAGVVHLLAVSGLHVGILAAFLYGLFRPLRRFPCGKELQLGFATALLWGYALLCGFSPSVVRAVLLFCFVSYALYLQRPGATLHFLSLAWVCMLVLLNPYWLLQVGFQLSFAAVGGIVLLYPALFRAWPAKRRPLGYIGKLVCVSLAAQAGTLPLTLYYFHQFPWGFLLSNLVLVPGIALILALGFACMLLQTGSFLPSILASFYGFLLGQMNAFIRWAGGLEGFFSEGIPWGPMHLALSGAGLALLAAHLRVGKRWMLQGAALCLAGLVLRGAVGDVADRYRTTLIIPHKYRTGGFWFRQGSRLQVFTPDSPGMAPLVRDAQTQWPLKAITFAILAPSYVVGDFHLRVLDQRGLYSPLEPAPDLLLLTGSPRIHLPRVLHTLRPRKVVADGSNYKSLVALWKKSCEAQGIPFHDTAAAGAFILQIPLANP